MDLFLEQFSREEDITRFFKEKFDLYQKTQNTELGENLFKKALSYFFDKGFLNDWERLRCLRDIARLTQGKPVNVRYNDVASAGPYTNDERDELVANNILTICGLYNLLIMGSGHKLTTLQTADGKNGFRVYRIDLKSVITYRPVYREDFRVTGRLPSFLNPEFFREQMELMAQEELEVDKEGILHLFCAERYLKGRLDIFDDIEYN